MGEKSEKLDAEKGMDKYFFRASAEDFEKIPGSPIAYWAPDPVIKAFESGVFLGSLVDARIALATGDNGSFIRSWTEVGFKGIGFGITSNDQSIKSGKKWFPCNKGGDYRKWYGNNDNLVNWYDNGNDVKSLTEPKTGRIRSHNYNGKFGFQESVTWSALSSGKLGVRYSKPGFLFVTPGSSAFKKKAELNLYSIQALLSSNVADYFLRLISATMNIEVGNILRIPFIEPASDTYKIATNIIALAKDDWDAYETSWDFGMHSLVECRQFSLKATYDGIRKEWQDKTDETKRLEEENNQALIDAYGLNDEFSSEVPLKEITLTCNPYYRYGDKKSGDELEALLLRDTMCEFISYAVGCMFGRYSLDKNGLILANQDETLKDYIAQVPDPQFIPDDDNVIPLIDFDGDWFEDDITERFKKFLKVTFGEDHFAENLAFIEEAIGKDIKKFFLKDFYTDHVKRYKKRPIYWMFSSPKGSFNALIYMHRYRPDTVSVVLNDYLREFRTKLQARKESHEQIEVSASASEKEKTQAIKAIQKINKVLDEINDYEHDTLYPLAGKPREIDLDDGVKHNYPLFGKALKKVPGLS